ncbi:hypothetical protein D3C80_2007190 [compost metagenome]
MQHGHRTIGLEQQGGHGFADDVRAADHHRVFTAQIAAGLLQQVQATAGRAGGQHGAALTEATDVFTVKTIDVLDRGDGLQGA